MNIKDNKVLSFIIIFLVYVLAATVGIFTYIALDFSWWLNLLIADAVSTVITFIFSLIFKNASIYDPYWSVQPIVIVIAFSVGRTLDIMKILLIFVICVWGVRLTANWAYTFKGLNFQDWRYTLLKEKSKKLYPIVNFFGIHFFPTLVVYTCILPAVNVILNDITANYLALIPLAVSVFAIILQTVSDVQMQKYRKNRTGNFIRTGLWKYARYPNYLGEILMWWGVAVFQTVLIPDKFYLMAGALINTLMFLFISIPLADGRQAKKEGFDEYKKETHVLIPIKK